jgi:hypothetical protein
VQIHFATNHIFPTRLFIVFVPHSSPPNLICTFEIWSVIIWYCLKKTDIDGTFCNYCNIQKEIVTRALETTRKVARHEKVDNIKRLGYFRET